MRDKFRILVVDDEAGVLETLNDIFEEKGYFVDKANCGKDAISKVKDGKFNMIFIDMKMPAKNGFETYTKIKKIDSSIVCVLMTAYPQEFCHKIEDALKLGAYGCLVKPFDPQEAVDLAERFTKEIIKKEK
ncbi:MAG: response regulator [Candidatus Omnitrophota bacterium]